jgi:uncharacterized protein involved in exopolysaccharide biosynthesis
MTSALAAPQRDGREEDRTPMLDLRPLLRALYRGRRLLAFGLMIGAAVGAASWMLIGRQYEAVVTLTINQPRTVTTPANPANYRALLENYSIAAIALKNAGLDQGARAMSPRDFLTEVLTIEEVRGTNLLRIHVRLHDPEMAARVANDVAQLAVDLNRRVNQEEGTSLRDQLRTQQIDAEERLRQAERALVTFEQTSQIDLLKADVGAMLKQRETLQEVEASLSSERAGEAASVREQGTRSPIVSLKRSIDSEPGVMEAIRSVSQGESLVGFGVRTEESNVVYQTIDEEVAKARTRIAQLEQERNHILNASDTMTKGGKLAELYRLEIDKARLEADLALARKVYEDVAFRHEQARVVVTSGSAQIQIVDAGVPSDVPVSWPITVWLVVGGVMGTALVAAWILGVAFAGLLRASLFEPGSG